MSIFDHALHIPTEIGLVGGRGAKFSRVLLPLRARPSWRIGVVGIIACLAGFACAALGTALAISPNDVAGNWGFKLCASTFFLASAILPFCVFITTLRDFNRGETCLVIDGHGILDRRLGGAALTWSMIRRVELVASGVGTCAVRVTLVDAAQPVFNPCRAGGRSARWTGRRHERLVALLLLDQRPHVLGQTILTLAARNGIAVEQALPSALSRL